jgi:High-affinity nickel-transport protein
LRSAILCLPVLFAAGMSLLDTLDGAFMNFAYSWAFSKQGARSTTTSPLVGAPANSPDPRSPANMNVAACADDTYAQRVPG